MLGNSHSVPEMEIGIEPGAWGPSDSISCISWAPPSYAFPDAFLATSWDSRVWMYSIEQSQDKLILKNQVSLDTEIPCLSACFLSDRSRILTGNIEGKIQYYDLERDQWENVDTHMDAIKDVYWSEDAKMVISVTHSGLLAYHDLRQSQPVHLIILRSKVYCSDMNFPHMIMGLGTNELALVNLKMQLEGYTRNISSLTPPSGDRDQLTAVAFNNYNPQEVGMTCTTGRTSVSIMTETNGEYSLRKKLTFKGHKSGEGRQLTLYPGNAVGFLPHPGAMFTGGSEGNIIFWNSDSRSTVATIPFGGRSVCKAKASPKGDLLAYALGYDWTRGIEGDQSLKSEIFVHPIQQRDLIKQNANNANNPSVAQRSGFNF